MVANVQPLHVELERLALDLAGHLSDAAITCRSSEALRSINAARKAATRSLELAREIREVLEDVHTEDRPGYDVCPACSGTGASRCGARPDDFGIQRICTACDGSGMLLEEHVQ